MPEDDGGIADPLEAVPPPLALMVLTRDPSGRMSGRKTVLATAARGLERAGLRVEAVVLTRHPVPARWEGRALHRVPPPGLLRTAASALCVLLGRRSTLNEALFDSPRVRRLTQAVAQRRGADLLVADGLRTSGPAMACRRPVVVHLDDLLSDRYRAMATGAGQDGRRSADVLGFYAQQLPEPLRRPVARLAGSLLAVEARRAERRERIVAERADVTAMTSPTEADELSRRTGRRVVALPMAVPVRPAADPSAADPSSFVFLGLLDYAPNREALRWWVEAVLPALAEQGADDIRLTVVGENGSGTALVHHPHVRCTGYVDDLGAELRRHRGMVAPVLSGAGVKTKVLDAWSVGLPVVATPAAATGLPPTPGVLLAADAPSFAAAVLRLRDDPRLAVERGRAGRALLMREWAPAHLDARWAEAVSPLLTHTTGRSRRA